MHPDLRFVWELSHLHGTRRRYCLRVAVALYAIGLRTAALRVLDLGKVPRRLR